MKAKLNILLVIIFFFTSTSICTSQTPPNLNNQQSEIWLSIFPAGQKIYGLYNDAKDSIILYACTHRGLFKTLNGGMTWTPIFSINSTSMMISQSNSSPNIMYLAYNYGRRSGVFKTINSGSTWAQIGAQDIPSAVQAIKVDYKNPDIIYVLSSSALFKSFNGGQTWSDISPTYDINSNFLAMDPLNSNHLVTSDVGSNLWETTDGGVSWQKTSAVVSTYYNGPNSNLVKSDKWEYYDFHPTNDNLRIALVNTPGWEPAHLVISHDRGLSWNDISIIEKGASPLNDRVPITSIYWSLKSLGTIYAGTTKGVYISSDYGNHWKWFCNQVSCMRISLSGNYLYAASPLWGVIKLTKQPFNILPASLGLPIDAKEKDSHILQIDQDQKIYVCSDQGGYYISSDGGITWNFKSIDATISTGIVKQLLVMKNKTIFINQGDFGNEFGIIHIGDREAHILKLTPDGKFIKLHTNRPPNLIGASLNDSVTIYMSSGNSGVPLMKSDDSGLSWKTFDFSRSLRSVISNSEITGIPTFSVAPQSPMIVYVALILHKPYYSARDNALMQTLDGGVTWHDIFPDKLIPHTRINSDIGDISAITIDPKNSRTIYLVFSGGVYKSADRGITWVQLPFKYGDINDIAISSQSSKVLYLASKSGIWVSKNAGVTWVKANVQDNIKKIISVGNLTLALGDNGIYRLTSSDLSWVSKRWKELEEKP